MDIDYCPTCNNPLVCKCFYVPPKLGLTLQSHEIHIPQYFPHYFSSEIRGIPEKDPGSGWRG